MTPGPETAGFVEPSYGGRTLADVLPAVAAALGVDAGFAPVGLELPPAPAYVVMLVDGLGADLLAAHRDHAPYLHALLASNQGGTAGVPSTTATSLTSLTTSLPPGAHGLVGFTQRVPETDTLLNSLFWDTKKIDPAEWQPHENAFERFGRAGVVATVVNKREFRESGLTLAGTRGAPYVPGDHVGERVAAAVEASAYAPSVTYVYESDLDWTGHRFGVDSSAWREQLIAIDAQIEQLRDALPPATRLLVCADHGMLDSAGESRIDIDALDGLRDGVRLLGGEARFRHLYVEDGALDDVATTWRSVLAERAVVMPRDEAIGRGWFGPVEDRVAPRIGDIVVAAAGDTALFSSKDFAYEMTLVGLHGSLTPVEMNIPLLVD